jgi:hypothetical protein
MTTPEKEMEIHLVGKSRENVKYWETAASVNRQAVMRKQALDTYKGHRSYKSLGLICPIKKTLGPDGRLNGEDVLHA